MENSQQKANYFKVENEYGDKLTLVKSYKGFALTVRDMHGNEAQIDLPATRWLAALATMRNVVMNSFRTHFSQHDNELGR